MIARKKLLRPSQSSNRLNAPVAVLAVLAILSLGGHAQAKSGQDQFVRQTARAKAILAQMTLDEKVGQLIQVERAALKDPSDVEKYYLGSVFNGAGSGVAGDIKTLPPWSDVTQAIQTRALSTRLHIPLLYGTDSIHGNNNVPGATIFPHNIGLGATHDPAMVRKLERVSAEETLAVGFNWAFAPCVTVPQDYHWGRTYEGYAQDPALVAKLGGAAVEGLQGKNLANGEAVMACVKHFAADGGTEGGHDQGDAKIDEATMRRVHLPGYVSAIQAGAGTIMPSFSSWNGLKVSANKHLMTDILKKDLGFEGFLISDWNAIDQLGGDYKSQAELSLNAGMDMFMITDKYRLFFDNVKALVTEGKVPQSRIDDAVLRILRVKLAMGLMDKGYSVAPNPKLQAKFGSAEHRQIARQAVRESLVLLKNEKKTLPIAKTIARIHICGRGGDDIGMQCGGWTLSWQGQMGPVPGGTSILDAVKKAVSPGTKVTYSKDGTGAEGATLGIVVVGEIPYSEGPGDRTDLALPQEDKDAIANLKKANIPVVVVLLSGRPMILGDALTQSDAFVAAWLPGTEGAGITDVLFGDYKPTGKLTFPWQRTMEQLPLHYDDKKADPLFAYGYGLTYGK
jgi:beta-glucosidase